MGSEANLDSPVFESGCRMKQGEKCAEIAKDFPPKEEPSKSSMVVW
jgi:hypothetical protein